ncbi:MAG: EAL and HDOD domain-containing protein [Aestuariibacter sp.]
MQVHVARQAILNRKEQTVAYELLFREGVSNVFPVGTDPVVATSKLVTNHHLNVGFKNLTRGKKALINFSEQAILDGTPSLLPFKDVVIEILEHTSPTQEVYEACKQLHEKGFRLALDDFQYHHGWERFLPFTSLIKFDIQAIPLAQAKESLAQIKPKRHIKLLAEKVETVEEYKEAYALGFHYFQGYYFRKPEMLQHRDIEAQALVVMAIYKEVMSKNINFNRVAKHFEKDMSLTYKLLRLINSGAFQLQSKISSIKQALVYLGDTEARKFIILIATAHLGEHTPIELVRSSVIRARLCEAIMEKKNSKNPGQAFLLGLFSLIDAILGKPMEEVILRLPLEDDIREALLGFKNDLFHLLELVKAYEAGSWYNTQKMANVVGINECDMTDLYMDALEWSETYDVCVDK